MSVYTQKMSEPDNAEQAPEAPQVKLTKAGKIDKRSTPEYKAECARRLRAGQARKNEYLRAGKELLNRKVVVPDSSSDEDDGPPAPINSADFALWLEFERFRLAKSLGVAVSATPQAIVVQESKPIENKPVATELPAPVIVEPKAEPAPPQQVQVRVDMTPSKPIPIPKPVVRRIARF